MKESVDDLIAKRIKELMEQYNPEYSPQAWDNLRKQIPPPIGWLKQMLRKYKFSLSVITIFGVLIIGYKGTTLLVSHNNSFVQHEVEGSAGYMAPMQKDETDYTQKSSALTQNVSEIIVTPEEIKVSSKVIASNAGNNVPVENEKNIPSNKTRSLTENNFEINRIRPDLLKLTDFDIQNNNPQLISLKCQATEINLSEDKLKDNYSKLRFISPDFSSLISKQDNYKRFVGPFAIAVFYSPEIHHIDSLNTLGVSQGAGVGFEGPIKSFISISAGLSYQSMNYNKTLFSEKVPPHIPPQEPGDTNKSFYYADSIGVRSGSYKFLELPVTVNFKFLESARSGFWLSAGISAVAFLKQNYTYETIVENVSEFSSVSVDAWENIYPVASFNIGLLYRYKFNNRLLLHSSVQYKQHLVQMGYNSMKLDRLNFQVGVVYFFRIEE